ncbi:phospholipase D-like domain-containing protein [Salipaludibacillus aurantiacus]|uniref:Putative cardiolipin synthase n=1 Tax=Salipaludibacillus aurantiacus TaxID=1601833 RepID=A0A1H9WFR1_9BACI|nr:phospholipase D family protein [Salipaludibacillus aurantiacus]SES32674.1 putative cardiolipin synthase [Salipaludibacillus aurantiacus]
MRKIKRIAGIVLFIIFAYVLYALISGLFIFQLSGYDSDSIPKDHDPERFYGDDESDDRVALIEGRLESKEARNNIKENAEETLDITNFKLTEGSAADIFHATIVEAADRGVQVRVLLDGMFHGMRGEYTDIVYAFASHPNIELKFYEPVDLLRPWTLNNRLHDKLVISDNNLSMITGRNIGDRYFAPEGFEGATNDRDAVIYNTAAGNASESVIGDIQNYFDYVWNHDFSQSQTEDVSERQHEAGEDQLNELREILDEFHYSYSELFHQEIDWEERSLPTRKVTFIHNPIERMNKEPLVWRDITNLLESAEEYIFMQSPFIIPSDRVMKHLDLDNIAASEVDILTNSLAASPNLPAFGGYARHREELAGTLADVHEYQGPDQSIHGKSYMIDDRISMIGSFNLDPRSVYLSTESMIVVDSEEVAMELRDHVDKLMTHESLVVKDDGSFKESEFAEEADVPAAKRFRKNVWAFFTRFFEHLL